MRSRRDIAGESSSRLVRARELLRGQLEALVRLAAIALRMFEDGLGEVRFDAARPLAGVAGLERAVLAQARVSWALRLIWALRAKLVGDLERVERGEGVDDILAAEARAPHAEAPEDAEADPEAETHAERGEAFARETERPERESFGGLLSRRSGDAEFAEILQRPTEEVIALIREALGLDREQAQGDAAARPTTRRQRVRRQDRPRLVDFGPGPPAPSPPPPHHRSLC